MQISVECGGYTRAADACLTANHTSAVLTEALAGRLAASAGMAGNDATSASFAAAYDAGAREALAALADLTHAFIGAGRLLAATGAHHASAEAMAGGTPVLGYSGGDLHDSAYARVRPAAPPSSLGRQEPSLGVVDSWILDQVEGFVWPGADVDLLRAAGDAWRRAAASTAGLADDVDVAISLVEAQRSPEVPLAVDALTDLATLIGDVAWQLSELASACEDYATAVDEARARTRALLAEIAQMIVEGAAISVIIAGLTGGLGGGATATAAMARVRSQAPRFYALLMALRAGVAATAGRIERVCEELGRVRGRAEKFLRIPARSEVGAMEPGAWLPPRKRGWLRDHETPPGHTIDRHVGKSVDELLQRLEMSGRPRASSFVDQRAAEKSIDDILVRFGDEIEAWRRAGGIEKLLLRGDLGRTTGTIVFRDGTIVESTAVKVVLIPTKRGVGWQVLTAYPD